MVSRPRPSRSRTQELAVGPHRVLQLFLSLVAHPTRAPIEVPLREVGRHAQLRVRRVQVAADLFVYRFLDLFVRQPSRVAASLHKGTTCRESNRLERRSGPADRELQSDVAPVADNGGLFFWVGCPDPR